MDGGSYQDTRRTVQRMIEDRNSRFYVMFLFAMDQSVESLKAALQRQVQKATKIDPSPLIYKITIIL